MTWDEFFMRQVYLVSQKSKDPRTRIGAILVRRGDNDLCASGFNGFPRGVKDLETRYLDRDFKHQAICHAEFNSIVNAARKGVSTLGSILYTQAPVCNECAKIVIQAGIVEIVYHKQFPEMETQKWGESARLGQQFLDEAGVKVRFFDMVLGIKSLVQGKAVDV